MTLSAKRFKERSVPVCHCIASSRCLFHQFRSKVRSRL